MITKKSPIPTLIVTLCLTSFAIFLYQYGSIYEKKLANKIYPNVFLDGKHIGEKTKDEIMAPYQQLNRQLQHTNILILYQGQPIATISATSIKLHSNAGEITERSYLIGRTSYMLARIYQKITSLLHLKQYVFFTSIDYDKQPIQERINTLEEQYNKPAKNALFTFENGRVISFRTEEKGLRLKSQQLSVTIDKEIQGLKTKLENKYISLHDEVIEPEITLAKANQYGIEELIAEGRSDYSHSIPERIHNVILATSKFNGVLIPPNKEFSFGDTIGDISSLTGYKPAYIIKEGKTVLGDGGGVCQVSTTLFRAALNAGLPIVERHAHAYRVSYYENDSKPGFDATVFAPTVDLKIKNDTGAYILIQTEIVKEKNLLYFRLYGKKDNRSVEISQPILYDVSPPPPPLYQDDPTLKKGVTRQIDFSAWGSKASFHYKVTRQKEILFEKNFFSAYKPWQAIYLVGRAD